MAMEESVVFRAHGGYRGLKVFQLAEIIYDGTFAFTNLYLNAKDRTRDQMLQSARSGKQNIAEGSVASGTSAKSELLLTNVARASLEELLLDYQDFLRTRELRLWSKEEPKARLVRALRSERDRIAAAFEGTSETDGIPNHSSHSSHSSHTNESLPRALYALYRPYIEEKGAETAANTLICLIHQANFLLDALKRKLEQSFLSEGGFTERLHRTRSVHRRSG
jgi:restriction system protein